MSRKVEIDETPIYNEILDVIKMLADDGLLIDPLEDEFQLSMSRPQLLNLAGMALKNAREKRPHFDADNSKVYGG